MSTDHKPPSDETREEFEERRRRERFVASKVMALLNGVAVRVLDVSLTGLGFESEDPLGRGGLHRVELFTEVGDLTVIGRISWCQVREQPEGKSSGGATRHRGGIRFSPLPATEAKTLARLLEQLAESRTDGEGRTQEETTSEFIPEDVSEVVRARRNPDSEE